MDFAVPPDFPYGQTNLGLSCAKSHSSCEPWAHFLHKIQFTHPESGNNITVAKIKGVDVQNGSNLTIKLLEKNIRRHKSLQDLFRPTT